jgi:uncharacterized Rmd1/YagE family protein
VTDDTREHPFHAVAFAENFTARDLARAYPDSQGATQKARRVSVGGGAMYLYPFGAVAFHGVEATARQQEIERLRAALPHLSPAAVEEDFVVREHPTEDRPRVGHGALSIDRLTPERAQVVALVVAQSAAMEYYERIVDGMFAETERLVGGLEKSGTMPMRVRALNRFIGGAVGTRSEVLSVLHLLDKPDETWDDPVMDPIYDELRQEFDLLDRYGALEAKLRAVQEALELLLNVARERRLFVVEVAIVVLILFEIVMSFIRH